jgi:FtsP/CotA-like multicopper oxidase with cupredoxin domain
MTMEAYQDTPLVNGTAYPYMEVEPKTYRFRILNGANDRMFNLQLYQASSIVGGIVFNPATDGGSGYATVPMVTITPGAGDTTGHGATALATIDPATGKVVAIDLVSVGSGYTAAPTVTIAAPTGTAPLVTATATATLYTAPTEVGMVPAVPGAANFPPAWTVQTTGQPGDILDNRAGGVPDPALIGPAIIQIGTEGGFLPAPVVLPNIPVGFERNPKDIVVGNVKERNLYLGPAERADVLIDFSAFAGKTIILYNDAPAAVPAPDSRLDYYTGDYDQTAVGGHAPTVPGFGPNTRTVLQFRVKGVPAAGLPLATIAVTAPGSGYTTPVVTITDPTGTGAAATATADPVTGAITGITLDLPGSGYTAPVVSISDASGTGATAAATLAAPVAYDLAKLQAVFATDSTVTPPKPGVFATGQDPIIVPQAPYNSAYGTTAFPADTRAYARIQSTSLTFNPLDLGTPAVGDQVATAVPINFGPKAIQELFENDYGRMNATLGVELPFTNGQNQTTIPYGYVDPVTEIVANTPDILTTSIGTPGDGTQIWKITHNGVDTHPIHFHLFNVQVLNRVGWDGAIRPPELNELGWKETVRMNPLEDCIVALRANAPQQPFGLPDSKRPLNPSMPLGVTGAAGGFFGVDPSGNPITVTNVVADFGWEYVWHCHILSHEEMDMMRPLKFNVARALPVAPILTVLGGTQASLSWTDATPPTPAYPAVGNFWGNPGNEIAFRIERSANGAAFATLATAPANATTFADTTILPSSWYLYRVVAFNAAGDSASNMVQLGTPAGLNAPTNLTATLQNGPRVRLTWTDNATVETGFAIERSTDGINFVAIATVGPKNNTGSVNYTDSTVVIGPTYTYRVKAVMNLPSLGFTASSAYSNPVTVAIVVPAAPGNVAVTAVRAAGSNDRATVTWADNSNNEDGFRIRWSTSLTFATGVSTGTVGANVTTFTTGNLPRNVSYYFQVQSFNNITGASAWVNATPFPVLTP